MIINVERFVDGSKQLKTKPPSEAFRVKMGYVFREVLRFVWQQEDQQLTLMK